MPLPYRTILRLPPKSDAVRLATQEVAAWLKPKIEAKYRRQLADGAFFEQGIHLLGEGRTLSVARADRIEDGSQRLLLRFVESNNSGTWEVAVAVIDYSEVSHRNDALMVEARRLDQPKAEGQVDPPRIVRALLERQVICDGVTQVTSEPRAVDEHGVQELFEAITDPTRSVSVIVATSLGREYDEALKLRVKSLTSKVVGVAGVFVLAQEATQMLNELLPPSHALEIGQVRTYLPKVDLLEPSDGRRHRVLGPATFARAIHGRSVAARLQAAFAYETRASLLSLPLPSDMRRGLELVDETISALVRQARIEERTLEAVSETQVATVPPGGQSEALHALVSRWLGDRPIDPLNTLTTLDSFIATQVATAETMFSEAVAIEERLRSEQDDRARLQVERENLELDLAVAEDDAASLRRRVEYLQRELLSAGRFAEAFAVPDSDSYWVVPASLVELATVLSRGSEKRHAAFERIEFTGDMALVEEVQKRDQVGRYVNAFWEYIQVLHDYVGLRRSGEFAGSLYMYLTDDSVVGKKCSPSRHAPTESDLVLANASWRAERILPVPLTVDASGQVLMDAHFRPTRADTFAPRMHYFDDTLNSGKVYVGYIGKHLTTGSTKNS
jgi:hypothetical protein